jgi:alpha-glucosidase
VLSTFAYAAVALEWWEGGNFYQIYPRSFKDSNGDGIGDLLGIADKVPYLKSIGMDGVWLSPIMASPQADYGYDISDYRDIHWQYGTLADFDVLLAACNANDVKLILDLVPNHSSDEHEWFKKSERREPGYENYYVWHSGKFDPVAGKRIAPNNWPSVFRFPSWTWSDIRKQFYYHAFLAAQPDLNYRNPKVVQEMKDVISYWLNKGVFGFRIDAVPFMFEVLPDFRGNFPDEPLTGASCPNPDDYCYTQHVYTNDRDETYDMIFQWRSLINSISAASSDKLPRIIMTEAYTSLANIVRFYGDGVRNGSHIPFSFELISNVNKDSTAKDYMTRIDTILKTVPKGSHANWVVSYYFFVKNNGFFEYLRSYAFV